jgi:hypothetical protein
MEVLVGIAGILVMVILFVAEPLRDRLFGGSRAAGETPTIKLKQLRASDRSGAADVASSIVFEHKRRYGVFKGFLPHWHQGYGNYEDGEEFVWLEYECRLKNPSVVLIQVEGPRGNTDTEWSGQKEALFDRVSTLGDRLGDDLPWTHERGKHASIKFVRANKSTSVFGIETDEGAADSPIGIAKSAIENVHAVMGPLLEAAWQDWWRSGGADFIERRSLGQRGESR